MVSPKDFQLLFYKIKSIDTSPDGCSLPDVSVSLGKVKMLNEVLEVMKEFYDSHTTGKVTK